jgi:hypothetical protein
VMGGVASENENDHDGGRLEDRRLRKRLRVRRFNVEAQNEGVRVRRSSIEAQHLRVALPILSKQLDPEVVHGHECETHVPSWQGATMSKSCMCSVLKGRLPYTCASSARPYRETKPHPSSQPENVGIERFSERKSTPTFDTHFCIQHSALKSLISVAIEHQQHRSDVGHHGIIVIGVQQREFLIRCTRP